MISLYILFLFLFRFISIYSNDCYDSCLNCIEIGNQINHKCSECKKDFAFYENTNNCYFLGEFSINDHFYIEEENRIFKCNSRCERCFGFAGPFTDNCTFCIDDYIKIQSFCINPYNKYTFKYLDIYNENDYSEISPLEHREYYSVAVYNYLETEMTNKNYNIKNISRLNLDKCIEKFIDYYNKTKAEFFIAKFDIINNTFHLNNLIFDIFDNFLTHYDTNICYNETVIVERPITNFSMINYTLAKELNNEYLVNIYDEDDEFFNNICFPFNYQKKSDVILIDRRKNFFQNVTLCEEGCEFKKINFNNDTIICECNISIFKNRKGQNNILGNNENELDFITLIKQFKIQLYNSNFFIIKCYKLVFSSKYLRDNYGFYFQMTLFALNFILFLIYLQKDSSTKIINYLIKMYKKDSLKINENDSNNIISNVSNFKFLNDNSKNNICDNNDIKINDINNRYYLKLGKNKTKNSNYFIQKFENDLNTKPKDSKINLCNSDIINKKNLSNYKKKYIYNKTKTNSIKKNNINFFFLYKKYIKQIHIFIKLFYLNKMEISIIQTMNLIFLFALQNTITAIFYDDQRISNVFYNEGSFSILEHLPKIIYSSLIMIFINFFLMKLITSKSVFERLLRKKLEYNIFIKKLNKKINAFHIKINIHISINFIFFLFFIYYCTAFCAVFRYNQKFWLLNAFVSFIFALIYPFIICIIFVLLKIISSKTKNSCLNNLLESMMSIFE